METTFDVETYDETLGQLETSRKPWFQWQIRIELPLFIAGVSSAPSVSGSYLTQGFLTTFRSPSHFPTEVSGGGLDQNFLRGWVGLN